MNHKHEGMCYNHRQILAVFRCSNCCKPICELCIKKVEDNCFCGTMCAVRHFAKHNIFGQLKGHSKEERIKRILVSIVILGLLAVFVM